MIDFLSEKIENEQHSIIVLPVKKSKFVPTVKSLGG
jgi:hypothetical protein